MIFRLAETTIIFLFGFLNLSRAFETVDQLSFACDLYTISIICFFLGLTFDNRTHRIPQMLMMFLQALVYPLFHSCQAFVFTKGFVFV